MIDKISRAIEDIQNSQTIVGSTINQSQQHNVQPQSRQVKLLEIKLRKIRHSIEEIQGELDSSIQWTKELFDIKFKMLQTMWNAISLLEEEIELDEIDYDDQESKDVLKFFNNIVNRMSEKLKDAESNQKTQYKPKLPDSKIPMFNGDLSKWNNFHDFSIH